jgi:hypothetical protein
LFSRVEFPQDLLVFFLNANEVANITAQVRMVQLAFFAVCSNDLFASRATPYAKYLVWVHLCCPKKRNEAPNKGRFRSLCREAQVRGHRAAPKIIACSEMEIGGIKGVPPLVPLQDYDCATDAQPVSSPPNRKLLHALREEAGLTGNRRIDVTEFIASAFGTLRTAPAGWSDQLIVNPTCAINCTTRSAPALMHANRYVRTNRVTECDRADEFPVTESTKQRQEWSCNRLHEYMCAVVERPVAIPLQLARIPLIPDRCFCEPLGASVR